MPKHTGKGNVLAACELPAWATGKGTSADIVVSTRASVSRNLAGLHFPNKADEAAEQRCLEAVVEAAEDAGRQLRMPLRPYLAADMSDIERRALREAYQLGFDKASSHDQSAIFLTEDRHVVIVVNAEDHVRSICLLSGLNATEACETSGSVADALGHYVRFAHRRGLGYLTARPAFAGTGVRVSTLVHLAGLQKAGRLSEVLRSESDVQATPGSLLPADGQAQDGLVELASRRTAGVNAQDVATALDEAVRRLVAFEQEAREVLMRDRRQELVDETWRALATLRHARLLSSAETSRHISTLRLGLGIGIVRGLDAQALNRLSLLVAPGLLQARAGRAMPESERHSLRAKIVRASLKSRRQ